MAAIASAVARCRWRTVTALAAVFGLAFRQDNLYPQGTHQRVALFAPAPAGAEFHRSGRIQFEQADAFNRWTLTT